MKMIKRGTITLGSTAIVSDPCYHPYIWCSGIIDNVLPGRYECFAEYTYVEDFCPDYRRVSSLTLFHEDYPDFLPSTEFEDVEIGVDSGQAGIFDANYYIAKHDMGLDDKWYERVMECTDAEIPNPEYVDFEKSKFYIKPGNFKSETEEAIAVLEARMGWNDSKYGKRTISAQEATCIDDRGFVSGSGYGDGSYTLFVGENKDKKVVSIRLIFI